MKHLFHVKSKDKMSLSYLLPHKSSRRQVIQERSPRIPKYVHLRIYCFFQVLSDRRSQFTGQETPLCGYPQLDSWSGGSGKAPLLRPPPEMFFTSLSLSKFRAQGITLVPELQNSHTMSSAQPREKKIYIQVQAQVIKNYHLLSIHVWC